MFSAINRAARRLGVPRSELLRQALADQVRHKKQGRAP
ncbi:MAG: ribbon-helix-helix protein, CopG family [Verrucomicrobiota bacterium]